MNYNFDDDKIFKLEKTNEYYENDIKFIEEYYHHLPEGKIYKRTLKYKSFNKDTRLTNNQLKAIKERLKWEPFTDNSNCKPIIGEDVFMEYNPEILISKKSQQFLKKLEIERQYNKNLEQILTNDNLRSNLIQNKKNEIINTSKIVNTKLKVKEIRTSLNNSSGAFVPKFKLNKDRNKGLNSDNKQTKSNKFIVPGKRNNNSNGNIKSKNEFSLKISHIIDEINEQYLHNWLYNQSTEFSNIRYKIFIPKRNNKSRDFLFINLYNQNDLDYVFKLLQNAKMEHQVISCEQSK